MGSPYLTSIEKVKVDKASFFSEIEKHVSFSQEISACPQFFQNSFELSTDSENEFASTLQSKIWKGMCYFIISCMDK